MTKRVAPRCATAVGALTAVLVACGGRSSLESYPGNSLAGDVAGGTTGGFRHNSFGGSGGAGVAGTFGTITAGMTAGGMAVGGMPIGGMAIGGMSTAGMAGAGSDQCQLSTTDCYTADEPECAGVRVKCQGRVLSHGLVWSTNQARVSALATAVDGRVALVGSFLGLLNVDNETLPAVSDGYDGFALVFDSEQNLVWSHFFGGSGADSVTGVDFAPGGDVLVQGADDTTGSAFVTRLDQQGKAVWTYPLGKADVKPGQIGVDNDGDITLVGGFKDEIEYRGNVQGAPGEGSYVIRLDGEGNMLWGYTGAPPSWKSAAASRLVVDDEDNLVVLGRGAMADGAPAGYVEKVSSVGASLFVRELVASKYLDAGGLAVDRKMQIAIGGVFRGDLKLGDLSSSSQGQVTSDLWLAKLGREGGWEWLNKFAGRSDGMSKVSSIATDPPGNIVMGSSDSDQVVVSKSRDDGVVVWRQAFAATTPSDVQLAGDNAGNMWLAANFTKSFDYGADVVEPQGNRAVILLKLSR
ncbi:MAG TPA: hypothetical protein VHB79_22035 [Polyangiaceae bacterium]|nr:hypothetical protein [Polyangiaceae bacterium]